MKFEVGLFNEEVRQCLKEGDRHKTLKDDWADMHYVEISADDEPAARRKIEIKYPASKGYVISHVQPA